MHFNVPKRRGKTLVRRAESIFGITTNPEDAGYISPSGSLIRFTSPSGSPEKPDRGHFRVMRLGSKVSVSSPMFINRTGSIRTQITPKNASFEVRQLPTDGQFDAMRDASKGRAIFIDITNQQGETINSSSFSDFSDAQEWISKNFSHQNLNKS